MNTSVRRAYGAVAAVTLTAALAACGGDAAEDDTAQNQGDGETAASECADVSLTLGHVWPENDPQAEATARFVDVVGTETDGSVTFEIFPAGQAGADRDLLEGLALGTTDVWVGGAGVYNAVSPLGEFFVTPFMFDGVEDMAQAYDGELGEAVREQLDEETDTTVLGFWPRGPRHITTNRAIETPEDLKGLRIRVPENPMFIAAFEAMGASPTPMAFTEVFTALQQGTIDGQENPLALIQSSGFAEVQSHLNLTGHIMEPLALAIADGTWNELCADQQEALRSAAQQVGEEYLQEVVTREDELRQELADAEMMLVEPDIDAFRKATQSVRETLGSEFADLYDLAEQG
jgi:tripartite ATP-independent transporter DctP family solute receptor